MPRAASTTSAGTSRMPVATLRIMIISENATMQMIALTLPRPTIGISSARNASVGIVYRKPLTAMAHRNTRSLRAAQMPMARDIANAIATDVNEITMCSPSAIAT
jgi:hypothetical protein